MALKKPEKITLINDLIDKFTSAKIIILINYSGLTCEQIINLRNQLEEKESNFKVIKNSLIKIACHQIKLEIDQDVFRGQLAMVFGFADEINPARIIYQFSKTEKKPRVIGAIYQNKYLESDLVAKLAKIPDRNTLETQLVGQISSPKIGRAHV